MDLHGHVPSQSAASFSICCFCFSASFSSADCTASRPPISNRVTISGSLSNRACSNSFRALSLRISRHNTPRESGHMKNLVARRISRYRLSASLRVLVSRRRVNSSSSSSSRDFSFLTTCLSNNSSNVSGPLCKRRRIEMTSSRWTKTGGLWYFCTVFHILPEIRLWNCRGDFRMETCRANGL